jgi:hypothetical protein
MGQLEPTAIESVEAMEDEAMQVEVIEVGAK